MLGFKVLGAPGFQVSGFVVFGVLWSQGSGERGGLTREFTDSVDGGVHHSARGVKARAESVAGGELAGPETSGNCSGMTDLSE